MQLESVADRYSSTPVSKRSSCRRGSRCHHSIAGGPGDSGIDSVSDNKELLLTVSGGVYDVVSWDPRGVGNLTTTLEPQPKTQRVGRVILDGVVDPIAFATQEPSQFWNVQMFSSQLVSADSIYKALFTGCALTGQSGCAAASEGDGPLEINAKVQTLLTAAYDATKVNASVPVTSGNIRLDLFNEMYTPTDWSNFMNEDYPQLVQIVNGEAPANVSRTLSRRSRLMDVIRRESLLERESEPNDSPSYTATAIWCADSVNPRGTTMKAVFEGIISTAQNVSHMFGAGWPTPFYLCSFWPVRSVERYQGPFNKKLANKILLASNIFDPITPLPSAEQVAGLLGQDAVLVRQNGFGHTTFSVPSSCMNGVFSAYMTNGTLPPNGTVCEVDADFEVFDGVNTADILANIPGTDV
ncbi:hypothetical protein K466DRAFT_655259 [Polyporus arcularius HHB13444]|uniref:Peptidase S33 tripeptidyl aminopeptidase-like C-terminal domain-containing protein n=1 Tax=Polyporus arcularius HHB13444 TaxID=1314778 RepID=A0A5C3P159_9APHY|nr:hypothetical protein K466DRAFT_655259 [Polyporus arcularius HHB13444]